MQENQRLQAAGPEVPKVDTGRVLGGLEQREHVGTRWAVQLDRCPQAGWRCKLG